MVESGFMLALRRVVLRSFRPRDEGFGGFCGAVNVCVRFRDVVAGALEEEITRQFDFGIFVRLRAASNGTWIHDSRPDRASHSQEPCLYRQTA